tara:strand:+ start:108 stop:425 length:318 start_codon:yes stop_codon:yes gene_type:complete
MYRLDKTSKTARFYSWVWVTDVEKFKSMCPYFWKYVLTILFIWAILPSKLVYYIMPAKESVGKGIDYIADSKFGQKTGDIFDKVANQDVFWSRAGAFFKWVFLLR